MERILHPPKKSIQTFVFNYAIIIHRKHMKKYLIAGIIAFLSLAGFVGYDYALRTDKLSLGGTCTRFVGALPTTLSGAGITTSATSIGVSSATIKQTGQKLNMQHFTCDGGSGLAYLTLEPGNTSRQEFVSCSGITQNSNGTAIFTGCSRGLEPVYPYTASSTFQFTHGGGTTVIVSNSPPFYDTFANKNNDATIKGVYTYASTSLPVVEITTTNAQLTANGTNTLATLAYVASTSYSGTVDATESVKGIIELGTALESASSTIFGSTGASVVMQSKNATDTPLSGCASGYTSTAGAGCSVIAMLNGKIKQSWYDLTEAFTFSGGATSTGTTTISASSLTTNPLILNGLAYKMPSIRGASSTAWLDNGSGTLVQDYPVAFTFGETSTSTGGVGTLTIAHGLGHVPKLMRFSYNYTSNNTTNSNLQNFGVGVATSTSVTQSSKGLCTLSRVANSPTPQAGELASTGYVIYTLGGTDVCNTVHWRGKVTSVDATNITLTFDGALNNLSTGGSNSLRIQWEAYR